MKTESVKPSENLPKLGFVVGPLWFFVFLKPSRADSNIARKTISKQLGDLFIIVTGWQLGDPKAISGWLE